MLKIAAVAIIVFYGSVTTSYAMDLYHQYFSYGLGSSPCSTLLSKKTPERLAADHWLFGFYTATTILTDGLTDLTDTATSHDPNRDGSFLVNETVKACRQAFSLTGSWQKLSAVATKVYKSRIKEIFKNQLQAQN